MLRKQNLKNIELSGLWFNEFVFKGSARAIGGLVTAWDVSIFYLVSYSIMIVGIFVILKMKGFDVHFGVMNVYDPCQRSRRSFLWDELRVVSRCGVEKIVVGKDFNVT